MRFGTPRNASFVTSYPLVAYLGNICEGWFGLGASRHNVKALSWSGSYASWLLYFLVYAVGFALFGLIESVREGIYSGETVDMRLGLGPARGWCAAMLAMMRMDPRERGLMLGAVAATEKSRNQPLASLSMSGN